MICDVPGWREIPGRRWLHPGSSSHIFSPRPQPPTESRCSPCGSARRLCSGISSAGEKIRIKLWSGYCNNVDFQSIKTTTFQQNGNLFSIQFHPGRTLINEFYIQIILSYPFRFPLFEVERFLPVVLIVLVIRVRSDHQVAASPSRVGRPGLLCNQDSV